MLDKFRDLSKESKILFIIIAIAGLIFIISLVSSYLNQQASAPENVITDGGTSEPTSPSPTPPPGTETVEPPSPEEQFPREDEQGNIILEDGVYSEEFGEDAYYSDAEYYFEAVNFLTKACIQDRNETFETKVARVSSGEKYMTTAEQYNELFFDPIFATNCKALTGTIYEETETNSDQSITFNVYLESEFEGLNGIRQITYNIELVKEADGYHVVKASMEEHELYG